MKPLVTVLTPTHTAPEGLFTRSIATVKAQTYKPIEHIVLLDCPSAETRERVMNRVGPDVRVVELNDVGHTPAAVTSAGAYAWSVGVCLAQGEIITHLCDDDEYLPDHVATHVKWLTERDADFSISKTAFFLDGRWMFDCGDGVIADGHLDSNAIVARRRAFQTANWQSSGSEHPDYDLAAAWANRGLSGVFIDQVTCRHHDGWLARHPDPEAIAAAYRG